jgi:hypothetical protein
MKYFIISLLLTASAHFLTGPQISWAASTHTATLVRVDGPVRLERLVRGCRSRERVSSDRTLPWAAEPVTFDCYSIFLPNLTWKDEKGEERKGGLLLAPVGKQDAQHTELEKAQIVIQDVERNLRILTGKPLDMADRRKVELVSLELMKRREKVGTYFPSRLSGDPAHYQRARICLRITDPDQAPVQHCAGWAIAPSF